MPRPRDPLRSRFLAMPPVGNLHGEYLRGRIVLTSSATAMHNRIIALIGEQSPHGHVAVARQGIEFRQLGDLPEPDVVFTDEAVLDGNPDYIPAELTVAVVEVVSPGNWRTDLFEKAEIYAEGGVSTYVIVDPRKGTVVVLSRSDGKAYQDSSRYRFGDAVPMPYGRDLDTSRFPRYPDETG